MSKWLTNLVTFSKIYGTDDFIITLFFGGPSLIFLRGSIFKQVVLNYVIVMCIKRRRPCLLDGFLHYASFSLSLRDLRFFGSFFIWASARATCSGHSEWLMVHRLRYFPAGWRICPLCMLPFPHSSNFPPLVCRSLTRFENCVRSGKRRRKIPKIE